MRPDVTPTALLVQPRHASGAAPYAAVRRAVHSSRHGSRQKARPIVERAKAGFSETHKGSVCADLSEIGLWCMVILSIGNVVWAVSTIGNVV